MLQAMNTGHEGSMTTTHANSPREAIARLETLCLMAGIDLPLRAIRSQLATSVHLIVQQTRYADGSRRVSRVSELAGLDDAGEVVVRDIFAFERTEGLFQLTGYVPACLSLFEELGLLNDGELL
jgi:pilus assembly protein CpaF